jgi:hypothetical protein
MKDKYYTISITTILFIGFVLMLVGCGTVDPNNWGDL